MLTADAEVGRLRILGPGANEPAVRAAVAGMVGSADVRPAGMPASAILVIRQIEHPAPRRPTAGPGPPGADSQWEQAMREAVSWHADHAARPVAGPVPAAARSVLFADLAELIACLAIDLVDGRAAERWWWRRIGSRLAPSGRAGEALIAEPTILPATLQLLADRGHSARVVSTLTVSEALSLTIAMIESHGVAPPPSVTVPGPERAPGVEGHEEQGSLSDVDPPWERWVPQSAIPEWLGTEQQLLVGIGMMMHRRASEVRQKGFNEQLGRWLVLRQGRPKADLHDDDAGRARRWPGGRPEPDLGERSSDELSEAASLISELTEPRYAARDTEETQQSLEDTPGPHDVDTAVDGDSTEPRAAGEPLGRISGDDASEAAIADIEPIDTALGGVLYLVNLLRILDLPAVFEPEWALASEVGSWGLVRVIGHALTTAGGDGDPIWELLEDLAGTPAGAQIGSGVPTGVSYVLPSYWWDELAEEVAGVRWAARGGAERSWSENGFMHTDQCAGETSGRKGPVPETVRRRRAPFDAAPIAERRPGLKMGAGLARWLALTVPAIERRLCLMLSAAPDEIESTMLARPARVFATRTHVDVEFPLDAASVAVRRSGLDRDPGWVPDLGRVVTFRFERGIEE